MCYWTKHVFVTICGFIFCFLFYVISFLLVSMAIYCCKNSKSSVYLKFLTKIFEQRKYKKPSTSEYFTFRTDLTQQIKLKGISICNDITTNNIQNFIVLSKMSFCKKIPPLNSLPSFSLWFTGFLSFFLNCVGCRHK